VIIYLLQKNVNEMQKNINLVFQHSRTL